jgi:protein gp37
MSNKTAIQWTDATWNPTTGCTKVSPGCAHCYIARTPPFRIQGRKFVNGATDLQLHDYRLEQPFHWTKPRRVFVNSLSDLFHVDVPETFLDRVFAVMALTQTHTYQVLTKRHQRMHEYLSLPDRRERIGERIFRDTGGSLAQRSAATKQAMKLWPSPNVWVGVSVENQHFADERIPLLLQTPAAVRFISAEPLLGPVDVSKFLTAGDSDNPIRALHTHGQTGTCLEHGSQLSSGKGHAGMSPQASGQRDQKAERPAVRTIDWVIVGGESGPGARPFDVAWARAIVQQCKTSGVACFVKQLGSVPLVAASRLRHHEWGDGKFNWWQNDQSGLWRVKLNDKKGGDPAEWPAYLRVREFPAGIR